MLHLIQTLVGNVDQNVFLITIRRKHRNSIIHSQPNAGVDGLHCRPKIRSNAACQCVCLLAIRMHKQKREFIAPDTKCIIRSSQRFTQCVGGCLQKQITLGMTESVVDFFELVQIKNYQGKMLVVSERPIQLFFKVLLEQSPIVQTGKRVGGGVNLQFLQVLIFHQDRHAEIRR